MSKVGGRLEDAARTNLLAGTSLFSLNEGLMSPDSDGIGDKMR